MVEFLGGPLDQPALRRQTGLVLSTSRGTFTDYQIIEPVPDGVAGHWRAQFDLVVDGGRSGRAARLPQVRRRDPDRDLDVPVPSFLEERAISSRRPGVIPAQAGIQAKLCRMIRFPACPAERQYDRPCST